MSSRLFGNSRSTDLRSPCLPSRENQTVPDADAGTYLRPGLYCLCPYLWSFRHSSETQAMKTDHSLYPATDQTDLEADWSVWMNWIMYHVLHCSDTSVKASTIYCCLKTVNGSRWYIWKYNQLPITPSNQAGFCLLCATIILKQNADEYKLYIPCFFLWLTFQMFPCVATEMFHITPTCFLI